MASSGDTLDSTGLTPDSAFAVLGNDTRMAILQTLGQTEEPLTFTDLRHRVGVGQGGQFHYHLDKLVGHFVRKTDEGYVLRQPGRRVVQAVLSGAVTEQPVLDRTPLEHTCWWCGGPIELSYRQERMNLFCTQCPGTYRAQRERRPMWYTAGLPPAPDELGYLGCITLPPAGVKDRSPTAAYEAAWQWEVLEYIALSNGLCPRCAGPTVATVDVCEHHDVASGPCNACGNLQAINQRIRCSNCIYEKRTHYLHTLYRNVEFLSFLTDHGLSPIRSDSITELFDEVLPYSERVLSTSPLRARLTIEADSEALTMTVDDDLTVLDVTRG